MSENKEQVIIIEDEETDEDDIYIPCLHENNDHVDSNVETLIEGILNSRTHYRVLGIGRNFDNIKDEEKLRSCYLEKSLAIGPYLTLHVRSELAFKRVAEAYEVLNNPAKRMEYDTESLKIRRIKKKNKTGELGIIQSFYLIADTLHALIQDNDIPSNTTFLNGAADFLLWIDSLFESEGTNANNESEEDIQKIMLRRFEQEKMRRRSIRKRHRLKTMSGGGRNLKKGDEILSEEVEETDQEDTNTKEKAGENENPRGLKYVWKEERGSLESPHNAIKGKSILRRMARVVRATDVIISSAMSLGAEVRKQRHRRQQLQEQRQQQRQAQQREGQRQESESENLPPPTPDRSSTSNSETSQILENAPPIPSLSREVASPDSEYLV